MKLYVASIFIAITLVTIFVGYAEASDECDINPLDKQDCLKTTEQNCLAENCCWRPSTETGVPWCYYKRKCNSANDVYYATTGMCYCAIKKKFKWDDAKQCCKDGGGNLAVISDSDLNSKLKKLADWNFGENTGWDVWFGLTGFHGTNPGIFKWCDGSELTSTSYINFENGVTPNDPDQCFCMVDDAEWLGFDCDVEQYFFCQNTAPSSACCDPHFMVQVQGMDDPVCFDYYGDEKDVLQLVYGPEDGLVVNGEIFKNIHTTKSWFGALSFMVPGCQITANTEGFTIEGRKHKWVNMDHQHCGSTSVTLSVEADFSETSTAAHLIIFVRPGVQFVFSKDHKVYYFGDITYMNFDMGEHYGLHDTTNGILGHFIGMKVHLDEEFVYNDTRKAILSFPDEPWRDTVTAKSVDRKILYSHKHLHCWNVDRQGTGLVRGKTRDYLVPDLLTNKLAQDLKDMK